MTFPFFSFPLIPLNMIVSMLSSNLSKKNYSRFIFEQIIVTALIHDFKVVSQTYALIKYFPYNEKCSIQWKLSMRFFQDKYYV